ncbi:unnamed protein product, partial [Oppiella nova]
MFLGGTVVSHPNRAQVAVCGHKWWQEFYVQRPEHQRNPSGSCFVVDLDKPNETPVAIFPLSESSQIGLQIQQNTYYYSHSMSGFSAAFTPSGESLLLGAPGFYQWRGTFLETEAIPLGINGLLKERFVLNQRSTASESYVGYSLTTGHFLSGYSSSVALGAPRDKNYRGKVYIYNYGSNHVFNDIEGTQ